MGNGIAETDEFKVGQSTGIERRDGVSTDGVEAEVVLREQTDCSEPFTFDKKLVDDTEELKVGVKVEVSMMDAVKLEMIARRQGKSPTSVNVVSEREVSRKILLKSLD